VTAVIGQIFASILVVLILARLGQLLVRSGHPMVQVTSDR
jgi:hypothetical protein